MAERPYETRTVTAGLELRDDAAGPRLIGYASTFNEPYTVGFFREQIHPEAFKRTLSQNPDVRLLVDHEGQPLARTKSGTLRLATDGRGLGVDADRNPKDPDWQKLEAKMERGDIDQMSFAFRVPAGGDEWDYSGDMPLRTIREASLSGGDVSVVTYPANEATSVQIRSIQHREAAYTLASAMLLELRAGNSVDTDRLQRVLNVLQDADTNLDASLAALSDILGVPNADEDQDANRDPAGVRAAPEVNSGMPSDLARRLAEASALRRATAVQTG